MRRILLCLAAAALGLLAACSADPEQIDACRRVIDAFEPAGAEIAILNAGADPAGEHAIRIDYAADGARHWIVCRFGGGGFSYDRLSLVGLATDREGEFSPIRLHILIRWLGMVDQQAPRGREGADDPTFADASYFFQQIVNALVVSCVYGLLAVAYTMTYAIIGRINLAFGEMSMIGGFTAFLGIAVIAMAGGGGLAAALVAALMLALTVSAVHGWATARLVFKPLRGAGGQAPLVATIGLAVFLQEYVRLLQGSRDRWLQPVLTGRFQLPVEDGIPVAISLAQILVLLLTAAMFLALYALLKRSRFGLCQRAVADDAGMAAMLGVDVGLTTAMTFALGAAYAAVAGYVIAVYYGGVNFFMGHMIGFKALTAAIVGGIGSVAGAMLGGLLIGLLETFWSAYFSIAYKDIAVFALLIAVLIMRPAGLLGRARGRGD
ncbi:MAG TPA: branched-chain amino acid ABC transporter permease [Alphaproteobacteria bacterium]|nr:branched-chain amino acid ABC transporter permease [Alphaproteobacteria bacterium]